MFVKHWRHIGSNDDQLAPDRTLQTSEGRQSGVGFEGLAPAVLLGRSAVFTSLVFKKKRPVAIRWNLCGGGGKPSLRRRIRHGTGNRSAHTPFCRSVTNEVKERIKSRRCNVGIEREITPRAE